MCRSRQWLYGPRISRNPHAAAAKVGARTLLLNTEFAAPELRAVCEREAVALLVHDDEFSPVVAGYRPKIGRVLAWVDGKPDGRTLDYLVAAGDPDPPPAPDVQQRLVMLTSGTTGTPKGAPRDIGKSLVAPGGFLSKVPFRGGRTAFVAAPVFHSCGLFI